MVHFLNNISLSLKSWLKTPVVCGLAVLMLAVGIGASVASYGFLNAALLQPLHVENPHELMRVSRADKSWTAMTSADYYDLIEYSPIFADCFLTRLHYGISFQKNESAVLMNAGEVSGNYFNALGIKAGWGRTIQPDDDKAGADPVVVISERFWRNKLGAREDLKGELIQLNGRHATVIGIIPESFRGTFRMTDIDVWFPHQQVFDQWQRHHRNFFVNTVIFRLREGVNATEVQAELDAFSSKLAHEYSSTHHGYTLKIWPEDEAIFENYRDLASQIFFIIGVLLMLLLITCANVSNILLAKVNSRRSELAVRRALGAPVHSVPGLLITDGMVIAILGGVVGILFTFLFIKGFSFIGMETQPGDAFNVKVLLFFVGVTLLVGLLCGLVPAIQAVRVNINEALKENSRTSSRFRMGGILIVVQVAFSLILLVGMGLFIRSLRETQLVKPGIRMENVLSFVINFGNLGGYNFDERMAFCRRLLEDMQQNPDIVSCGFSEHWLLQGSGGSRAWSGEIDFPEDSDQWLVCFFAIGPGFLETMNVPIVRGRSVTFEDYNDPRITTPQVGACIINETLAGLFWPNEDPIGREFIPWGGRDSDARVRVIGVCRDFRVHLREKPPPLFMDARSPSRFVVVAHTRVNPEVMKPAIVRMMHDLEPSLPVQYIRTIEESAGLSIQSIRSAFTIMLVIGFLGLAISVIGVYAALSNWIQRSSQEIGLRMALGAAPSVIVKMYVRRGALIVLGGLLLGSLISIFAMPFIQDLVYEVSPRDPVTLVVVLTVLFFTSALACYFSARNAARIDPMVALRKE